MFVGPLLVEGVEADVHHGFYEVNFVAARGVGVLATYFVFVGLGEADLEARQQIEEQVRSEEASPMFIHSFQRINDFLFLVAFLQIFDGASGG